MTVVIFTIWNRAHAEPLGHALVCPAVRYASVQWISAARLDRRFADIDTWRLIETELHAPLPSQPMLDTSKTAMVLAGERRHDVRIQYLTAEETNEGPVPAAVASELDARLQRLSVQPSLRLTARQQR